MKLTSASVIGDELTPNCINMLASGSRWWRTAWLLPLRCYADGTVKMKDNELRTFAASTACLQSLCITDIKV